LKNNRFNLKMLFFTA